MAYLIKVPSLVRRFFGEVVWQMPADKKTVFLTFDDGPHPTETPFVLDELKKFNAKGTFFCIGKNVEKHPDIYQRILDEGHAVGNHTFNHLNGWEMKDEDYFSDVAAASALIGSKLFRPPYGRIRKNQVEALSKRGFKTIMWTAISADFDEEISTEKCVRNVMKHAEPGAIIVFHDSKKASVNLRAALPAVLEQLSAQGYRFDFLT